jgi:hypothetical protein
MEGKLSRMLMTGFKLAIPRSLLRGLPLEGV